MKKLKKHTLRAERNMVCALCAIVFLVFAGAAIAGWIAAPFPVGAVLTGVAAFVLLFTGILSGSWIKYAKRFYAAAVSPDYPCAIIGEGLTVTFCAVSPEKAAAYLREGAALPPLPKRYTREQWSERSDTAKDIRARTLGDAQTVSYPAVCGAAKQKMRSFAQDVCGKPRRFRLLRGICRTTSAHRGRVSGNRRIMLS